MKEGNKTKTKKSFHHHQDFVFEEWPATSGSMGTWRPYWIAGRESLETITNLLSSASGGYSTRPDTSSTRWLAASTRRTSTGHGSGRRQYATPSSGARGSRTCAGGSGTSPARRNRSIPEPDDKMPPERNEIKNIFAWDVIIFLFLILYMIFYVVNKLGFCLRDGIKIFADSGFGCFFMFSKFDYG